MLDYFRDALAAHHLARVAVEVVMEVPDQLVTFHDPESGVRVADPDPVV
jgi:hypothetical protein